MQRMPSIVLRNRHVAAGFTADGTLTHLATNEREPGLIAGMACGYFEVLSQGWYGDTTETTNRPIAVARGRKRLEHRRMGGPP
jgi:hypothetical protein